MRQYPNPAPPIHPRPARLIRLTQSFKTGPIKRMIEDAERVTGDNINRPTDDIAMQPTNAMQMMDTPSPLPLYQFKQPTTPPPNTGIPETPVLLDVSQQSTMHLMQLSGMMPPVRVPRPQTQSQQAQPSLIGNQYIANSVFPDGEEGWWPYGIQQTGPLPVVNLYGRQPFGQMLPPAHTAGETTQSAHPQPVLKTLLGQPAVKVVLGLVVGIGLLFLVSKFVNIPETVVILKQNLTTPRGILLALLSGVAFLIAFSIRGVRWKLFLNPIGEVSTFKAIQLFLVGIFLNFLLPIRGGEVAKSLMLKRIANIPVSKSLPTVAMDKALDLMPALFIMAVVPLLGIQMDIKLWAVLGLVSGLLIGLIFFVGLAAWKRDAAISLLQKITGLLPAALGSKIEGFATGFVDSLLMGASQPRIFIPAVLLTCVAVIFDGLFAMLAFWTIGYPITFGTAIFGYTVYNMFYILPTPPGQVGSNEVVGLLVFAGLLHLPADKVTAMFVFSHPWAALLMCGTGMACLSALGLTLSSAMKVQSGGNNEEVSQAQMQVLPQMEAQRQEVHA